MIRKNIRTLICSVLTAAMLCSCTGDGMTDDFRKYKSMAESKSGIQYKTTYFVENRETDGRPYPQENNEGKIRYVMNDENGNVKPLTDYVLEDGRETYNVAENYFFAPAKYDGKWGYLLLDIEKENDGTITWEIEPQYDNVEYFTEHVAAVEKDRKYGMINENGEMVLPFIYDCLKFCTFGYIPAQKDGSWYFINVNGERVFGPFEDAESFDYGYAAVKKNGKWGYIDKSGTDATAYVYDEAYSVDTNASAWVRKGNKWSYVKINNFTD